MVSELLEGLMREERTLYPKEHHTNRYYTRDLLTLAGPVEDLEVSRVREGGFIPKSASTGGARPCEFRWPSWPFMPSG